MGWGAPLEGRQGDPVEGAHRDPAEGRQEGVEGRQGTLPRGARRVSRYPTGTLSRGAVTLRICYVMPTLRRDAESVEPTARN